MRRGEGGAGAEGQPAGARSPEEFTRPPGTPTNRRPQELAVFTTDRIRERCDQSPFALQHVKLLSNAF